MDQQCLHTICKPGLVQPLPVYDLPGIGQVSYYLHGDQDLFLDVDGANHLVQELPGVSQELAHLQVGLKLVELLDLSVRKITLWYYGIITQHREVESVKSYSSYFDQGLDELYRLPPCSSGVFIVQRLYLL